MNDSTRYRHRRQSNRISGRWQAWVQPPDSDPRKASCLDLGVDGARIQADLFLGVGNTVYLTLDLGQLGKALTLAKIIHSDLDGGIYGAQFIGVAAECQLRLVEFVHAQVRDNAFPRTPKKRRPAWRRLLEKVGRSQGPRETSHQD